jgi:hypothetical protein
MALPSTMPPEQIPPTLVGVAGEYYVAAELSRRGFIASISLRNTRGTDILATNQEGTRSVTIQVKTTQQKGTSWILNEKAESFFPRNHFYVFVRLRDKEERPEFHVVPSRVVAKYVKKSHHDWLGKRGKGGRRHHDSSVRQFRDLGNKYLEKWRILRLSRSKKKRD